MDSPAGKPARLAAPAEFDVFDGPNLSLRPARSFRPQGLLLHHFFMYRTIGAVSTRQNAHAHQKLIHDLAAGKPKVLFKKVLPIPPY